MVFKELDPLDWQDQSVVVRRTADDQMPYYLRRYFGNSAEVDVLNQLRVSTGGVRTQVDHLLMHSYGLVVVDSRSVSGRLQVMDDGRWICLHREPPRTIPSPVTHAYAQALSLKAFLAKKVRQKGFSTRSSSTSWWPYPTRRRSSGRPRGRWSRCAMPTRFRRTSSSSWRSTAVWGPARGCWYRNSDAGWRISCF